MPSFYVSPTGNDITGNGSVGSPYLTLDKAINVASNGDTIYVMNGTHTYTTTVAINKELTITSQNGKANAILSKTTGGDFLSIVSSNVTITDLTIQATATNTADALVSISRNSSGFTLPTKYSNISITNNNLKMYKYGVTINGGNITVTGNTFSRQGGTERLSLFLVYYIRDTITISNNTHVDTLRTQRFVYLTGAGTSGSDYLDRINSKGGNLIINNNSIDTSANTTQKPIMFNQDYYNNYTYGPVGSDSDYNSNTKLTIIMNSNTMIGNATILCDFFSQFLISSTSLNSYDTVTLQNNTVSHSNVGILKLDGSAAITIDSGIIDRQYVYNITGNTITNFALRADYTGDQVVSQNTALISPANIYLLVNTKFISTGAKTDQTISFDPLPDQIYLLDNIINLNASATSGLAVSYSSSDSNVVLISGSSFIIKGVGSATITASQAGDLEYNAAPNVNRVQNILAVNEQQTGPDTYLTIPITVTAATNELVSSININIIDIRYTTSSGVGYGLDTGFTGTVSRLNISALDPSNVPITDFSSNPLILNLDLPNANPSNELKLYKLVTGTNNLMVPQPPGYPVTLTYLSGTLWTGQLISLSDYIILDSTPPGGIAGGDPHIINIYNKKVTIPNEWKYVKLYQKDDIQVNAKCDFISEEIMNNLHRYNLANQIEKINPIKHKYVKDWTFITELDIYKNNELLLKWDMVNDREIINKGISVDNQEGKGLFSLTHKKPYPPKNSGSHIVYLNNNNFLTFTIDNFWDDINNVNLVFYEVNKDGYSGEFFEHSINNKLE